MNVERHLILLKPGGSVKPGQASALSNALDVYLPALLEARYPRHPHFGKPFTKKRVEELVATFGKLVDSDDKQLPGDRAQLEEWRGTLGELGIVRITERSLFLSEAGLLHALENRRRQQSLEKPSVRQVRAWIDERGHMGLESEVEDLILRCYARLYARTFVAYDRPYEPKAGSTIPDDVMLEQPPLPLQDEWQKALSLAAATFGKTLPGKALHADNLKRFEQLIKDELQNKAPAAARLPALLNEWARDHGVDAIADRLRTAQSADALCAQLAGKTGKQAVETLASFHAETSAKAVGQSLATAAANLQVLGDTLVRGAFQQLRGRASELAGADELLGRVQSTLRQDELVVALGERVRSAAVEAQDLLRPPAHTAPARGTRVRSEALQGLDAKAAISKLRDLAAQLEREPELRVKGVVELWKDEP
jgi:hypothetical protein